MSDHAVKVGDWVMFMSHERPVIGEVLHVAARDSWRTSYDIATTAGTVQSSSVLVVRGREPLQEHP